MTGLRQQHRRCIYCTIVVGETVTLKSGIEYERFTRTDKGPVCEYCAAKAREVAERKAEAARAMNKRLTPYGRHVRNARILRMRENGMARLEIATLVGLSPVYVGKVLARMRACHFP